MAHADSFNITNSYNNIWGYSSFADEVSQILAWLSPLEPRLRHQDVRASRVGNVGEWLLKTEEFRSWHTGSEGGECSNAVLFCYGNPGVGKTYISSLVIDKLCDQAEGQNATVACFYFDFAAQKEQTPTSMLGALLKQLVWGLEEAPEEIERAYQGQKNAIGGRGLQLSDIVKMLQTTSSRKRAFICIDALDECVAGYRVKLLDSLNQILEKSPGTRIFVTGRAHIQPEIGRCLAGRVASVSISPKRDDIIGYLLARMHEDTTPDEMDSSLEAEILKLSTDIYISRFLLVSLNIDAILQEPTIHRRRQKLSAMTDGLGLEDVYGATLGRIKGQGGEKSRLGMAALMWISHSERPLKADELRHALAVEIGSPNLNADNAPSIGTLLACCQGLIAVEKEASTVRLIHFTLQEYLRAHPELFGTAHSAMAEACLSYLNSQQVNALSTSPSPNLRGTPFLEYASLYWGTHAKRDLSDCAKLHVLKLFDALNNHISIKIFLKAQRPYWYSLNRRKPFVFSGLHYASAFGIVEIVVGLVELGGCDINQRDCTGRTPLEWAAWNGHEKVVEIFLGRDDVNPDKTDEYGRTPLWWAARNGREGVVKILLGRDNVDPDKPDIASQTPLGCAAQKGREGVVKTLLGRGDVDPDKPNKYGQTPLWWAVWNGHEGVVKILLGLKDVNPNKPDEGGQTPLCCAAWNGHEGVVKILLGQGNVDPDETDNAGQTPLCRAARNGREGVVKILLGRGDVNPDKPNKYGQTPLWWAVWNGHKRVVKMLLGRGNVNPNKPDESGQTPLCLAARSGHEGVVRTLLGRYNVNPDEPNGHGETPLCCAARNGCEGVVKILLGRDKVNPNKPDEDGQTPLCLAARSGHEGVVKILLGRDNINPDEPNKYGETPLCCAAQNGYEGVVKILLRRADVSPDKPNKYGETPLCCAARSGYEGMVRILLGRDDVNSDKPDEYDQTPLWWAAREGHKGVVKMLLGRDNVNPDRPNKYGETPLCCAAQNGHEGVVKMLLGRDDVNPHKPDTAGHTPLWWAAKHRRAGVVALLRPWGLPLPARPDAGAVWPTIPPPNRDNPCATSATAP